MYDYLDSTEKKELDKTNSIAKQVDSQVHEINDDFDDEESNRKINVLRKNTELSIFKSSTTNEAPIDYTLNDKGKLVPIYKKKINVD